MSFKATFARVIDAWALFGGALILIIVGATAINAAGFTANTLARLWGGSVPGLPGYEDAVTLLVGVAALAMFPYCQLHGGHAAVDVFMQKAPAWANRAITGVSAVAMAALAMTMAVMLVHGTLQTRADNVETAVLGWPVWAFMWTAVVSCLLWAGAALMPLVATDGAGDGT
ncbi:MAG: TRAP transporter small permease subunit [Pseudomonadota bacterium]